MKGHTVEGVLLRRAFMVLAALIFTGETVRAATRRVRNVNLRHGLATHQLWMLEMTLHLRDPVHHQRLSTCVF